MRKALSIGFVLAAFVVSGAHAQSGRLQLPPVPAAPQTPVPQQLPAAPVASLELDEAIARALARNPTVQLAATSITRAEALLQQSRSIILPAVSGSITNVTLDSARGFSGGITQPQNQVLFSADANVPILAPAQWAAVNQARDQIIVATKSVAEIRQQIAVAAAEAYLSVIAAKRQVDVEERALENARAHTEYAEKRFEGGVGSRLNQLRAAQTMSTEQTRLEAVRLALLRAQEALGVLVVEDGPVDAASDPVFEEPPPASESEWMALRPDIQFQQAVISAAERVVSDSWKDYLPTATVDFQPLYATPAGLFQPAGTWRLAIQLNQVFYEGGARKAAAKLRDVSLDQSKLQLTDLQIQARSEVRVARESLASFERALVSARLASDQANQVLDISTRAFEVGATTNLEVIDAQREARDTDTARALAEDAVRHSRLNLLVALGRFPK
jgi:multidrug efflux system outer membrane protein